MENGTWVVRTALVRHTDGHYLIVKIDVTFFNAPAGILQMLLSAPPTIVAPHWDVILDTIEWLLKIQQPSGNWPHKATAHFQDVIEPIHDELIQSVSQSTQYFHR